MGNSVAHKIREFRNKRGITQIQLSKETKLSRNTIVNYETGKRDPRIKDLRKIAKEALNVHIQELISDTEQD